MRSAGGELAGLPAPPHAIAADATIATKESGTARRRFLTIRLIYTREIQSPRPLDGLDGVRAGSINHSRPSGYPIVTRNGTRHADRARPVREPVRGAEHEA